MSSRQEEKEQRRRERMEQEQREKAATGRRRRMQIVGGGVLGVALVAAVIAAIAMGGGNKGSEAGKARTAAATDVKLPEPQETNFEAAAKAAGCDLQHPPNEGAGHADKNFTAADYKTNPPTSGAHEPTWYDDGIYDPGNTPRLGMLVHTLEHGRIDVQYKPGTDPAVVKQLEAFLAEKTNYHLLLFQNETGMKYQVAATAWNQLLGCPTMNDKVFDALRTFYDRYVDKGPERVP
jgi:hypothetical protein